MRLVKSVLRSVGHSPLGPLVTAENLLVFRGAACDVKAVREQGAPPYNSLSSLRGMFPHNRMSTVMVDASICCFRFSGMTVEVCLFVLGQLNGEISQDNAQSVRRWKMSIGPLQVSYRAKPLLLGNPKQ